MPTTSRGGYPYPPLDGSSVDDVPADLKALADRGAEVNVLYLETVAADRPAPGVAGRLHRATDTGVVTWDTGSSWDDIAVSRAGGSTITPSGAAVKGLVVRAVSGQTANLLEVQDSAGVVTGGITSDGGLAGTAGAAKIAVFGQARVPTGTPLVVRGAAAQVANLAEFQNSAGTAGLAVDASSRLAFGQGVDGQALGAYVGRIPISVNGETRYLAFYS